MNIINKRGVHMCTMHPHLYNTVYHLYNTVLSQIYYFHLGRENQGESQFDI